MVVSPSWAKGSSGLPNIKKPHELWIISKILERVVYNQVESYLQSHKLLYEFQAGFRSRFSTATYIIHLTDHIRSESDQERYNMWVIVGNYTGMVILDLQRSFDTVDHQLSLNKLQTLGFNSLSVAWCRSYLTCDKVVNIGDATSPPHQWSPYISNICQWYAAVTNSKLFLYADDSAILVSGKDVGQIQATLSKELESIREWLIDDKLSLHLGKTESILFGTNKKTTASSTARYIMCWEQSTWGWSWPVFVRGDHSENTCIYNYLFYTEMQNLSIWKLKNFSYLPLFNAISIMFNLAGILVFQIQNSNDPKHSNPKFKSPKIKLFDIF